jgi:hypothetical protein
MAACSWGGVKERRCGWVVERSYRRESTTRRRRLRSGRLRNSCLVMSPHGTRPGAQAATRLWPQPIPASCRSCSFLLPRVFILRTRSALPSLPSLPHSPHTPPPPAPPRQSPATYPPPSVLHQLSSSISSHVPWVPSVCSSSPTLHGPNARFTLAWGLCTASLPASPTARPILQPAPVLATHPVGCQSCHRLSACSHSHYADTDAYSSPLLGDNHLFTQSALACFLNRVAGQTRPSFPSFWLSPLSSELILHLGSPCRPTCICLLHCRHPSPEAPYISETWMVRCLSYSHGQARVHSIGQMSSYGIRPVCLVQMPI